VPFVLLWLKAFALTCLLETPLGARLLRPSEPRLLRRVLAVLVANLASHPAVWFVFPELGAAHPGATLALSEFWAFASELGIYRLVFPSPSLTLRRAALIAALANALSFATGWALRAAWRWP
jgi:hypothetical protein